MQNCLGLYSLNRQIIQNSLDIFDFKPKTNKLLYLDKLKWLNKCGHVKEPNKTANKRRVKLLFILAKWWFKIIKKKKKKKPLGEVNGPHIMADLNKNAYFVMMTCGTNFSYDDVIIWLYDPSTLWSYFKQAQTSHPGASVPWRPKH